MNTFTVSGEVRVIGLLVVASLMMLFATVSTVRADDAVTTDASSEVVTDTSTTDVVADAPADPVDTTVTDTSETSATTDTTDTPATADTSATDPSTRLGQADTTSTDTTSTDTSTTDTTTTDTSSATDSSASTDSTITTSTADTSTTDTSSQTASAAESLAPPVLVPELSTDQLDYAPGSLVSIIGDFFGAIQNIFLHLIGTNEDGSTSPEVTWDVWTNENGSFTTSTRLDYVFRPFYTLTATDKDGTRLAQTIFTDAAVGFDLSQCAQNDSQGNTPLGLGLCNWIGGALGSSNSTLYEGIATEQQLIMTGMAAGSHTLVVGIQTTKGGNHAYDFLVSDAPASGTMPASTLNSQQASAGVGITLNVNRCGDDLGNAAKAACNALLAAADSTNTVDVAVPDDSFISVDGSTQTRITAYEVLFGNRTVRLYTNGTFSVLPTMTLVHMDGKLSGSVLADGADTNDSYIWYTITWTGTGANAMLVAGADIALGGDGTGRSWGPGRGATGISGNPYHFYLIGLDGSGGGADNQMSSSAIFTPPGSLTIIKDADPNDDQDFSFTATGGLTPSPFALDDDADGTLSNMQLFSNIASGTVSTITETPVAGWALTSPVSCTGATQSTITQVTNGITVTIRNGENVTCTFVNTLQQGSLQIVKRVVNDNGGTADTGAFGLTSTAGTLAFGAGTADGANTLKYSSQVMTVNAGSYTLRENDIAGYSEGAWACTGATPSDTSINNGAVTVPAGGAVVCTITNDDQQAFIVVDKTVLNNSGGTAGPNDFLLTVDGNAVSDGIAFAVNPGSHTAGETLLPGYSAGAWGGDCNVNASVTVALGETKTCTITNDDVAPVLHLRKVVTNDNGGTATVANFTLTADGAGLNDISGTSPVDSGAGLQADTFALSETNVPGYTASAWSCIGGTQNGSNITLGLGQEATCTITNDDIQPKLTVTKVVVNDNGGTKVVADFPLFVGATGVTSGVQNGFNAGSYTVSETNQTGYAAGSWGGDCATNGAITLAPGDVKACTITNDDIAPKLHLRKVVTNDNGGTATVADFTLTANGAGANDLSGTSPVDSGAGLLADTWTLSETSVAGYTASDWVCVGGTQGDATHITVGIGGEATCTITNDDQQAYIILNKTVVNNNGGTAQPNDFLLRVDGGAALDEVALPVNPGAHVASETLLPGYAAGSWGTDCDASGNVSVALGETKTCTITNNDIAPKLHLRKVVVNDNGGTKTVADFTLTADGAGSNDLSGMSPVDSGATLQADTFALSETNVTGYAASDWVCVGGTQNSSNITVGIGGEATCTITNDDIAPKLTLTKVVTNDDGGDAVVADFPLFVDATGVTSGVQNTFNAGAHTASETNLTGYTAGSWTGDCAADGSITLNPGDVKACTITNDDQPAKIVLIKNVINDNGGTAVPNDFDISVGGGIVLSGSTTTVNSNTPIALNEDGLTGYTFVSLTGDAKCPSVLGGTVTLNEGETVTCTITNDDNAPALHLRKIVVNDNGGTAVDTAWTLTANGTGANDLSGTTPVDSGASLKADTFALGESGPTGYSASQYSCVKNSDAPVSGNSITLGLGDTATCTITNDDIAPSLTLNKITNYTHGGTAPESTWTLTADGGTSGTLSGPGAVGSADVVSAATFQVGTYTLSESAAPTGYTNGTSYSCVKNSDAPVSGNSITLGLGDTATCSITNTDQPAHLIVIKHVINDDNDVAQASDFTMHIGGVTLVSPSVNDFAGSEAGVNVTVNAGIYTVNELDDRGYVKTLSADCSGTIGVGETKTCTITNNDIPHATRTLGFWQTHTQYTTTWFNSGLNPLTIGTHTIDSNSKLFAGFYASISKKSTGAKRTQLDQARMQMLQQWLAAKLNCEAFGCSGTTQTLLTNAATAFAGSDRNLILSFASQLDAYNNSNDPLPISGQGKATPKDSTTQASSQLSFWNSLP